MRIKHVKYISALSVFICLSGSVLASYADNRMETPLHEELQDQQVILYVDDLGDSPQAEGQVGIHSCSSIDMVPIKDQDVPIETVFLIDNSLSTAEDYRPMISNICIEATASRMDRETFTVITFSDHAEYLLQGSNDYSQVKKAIESVSYQYQDTYLTDVLYGLLEDFAEGPGGLKRILVFTDGLDNNPTGITENELYDRLENISYPIYTIGFTSADNEDGPKKLAALSRRTGGTSWQLDEVEDPMDVVAGVTECNDAWKITLSPEPEDCDGTTKGVNLKITSGADVVTVETEVKMPFGEAVEASSDEEKNDQPTETESPSIPDSGTGDLNPVIITQPRIPIELIIGATAILAVILILVIVLLVFRKKKHRRAGKSGGGRVTSLVGKNKRKTELLGKKASTYNVWERKVRLTDPNDPATSYEAAMRADGITIGYDSDCQIRIDNKFVSGHQCRIFTSGNQYYVSNLSHSNVTVLDGVEVSGDMPISNGSILTLGDRNYKVEI